MSKKKLLLVEDDASLGFVIEDNLIQHGFSVTRCTDGETGLNTFSQHHFDLCLLDVMLPKKDGFTLAKDIRQLNEGVPILFLTAKSMQDDRLEGFKTGADDYITKPFNMEELVYRIEVFLRRTETTEQSAKNSLISIGTFEFDFENLTLKKEDDSKTLTQKEASILKLFYENKDNILKREEILLKIWGNDDYFLGRSLDVFISKLRKYLKADPSIEIINYHGVGFKFKC